MNKIITEELNERSGTISVNKTKKYNVEVSIRTEKVIEIGCNQNNINRTSSKIWFNRQKNV